MSRSPLIALGLLLLAGCAGGPAAQGNLASADELCLRGVFTDEGVECPAFRGEDGTLYTLTGLTRRVEPGEEHCICGVPAMISFCMQGVTIAVSRVGPPESC